MFFEKSHEYLPVQPCEETRFSTGRPSTRPRSPSWTTVALLQAAQLAVLAVAAFSWHIYGTEQRAWQHVASDLEMPTDFSTSKTFYVDKTNLSLVRNTREANEYWLELTAGWNNGLVTLPDKLTAELNLPPSDLPTNPGESVYQVDAFHQLHCLERLRQDLLSGQYLYALNPNLQESEYFAHTLHCVDYLRQALMCNADLTLVSSGSDREFEKQPQRQCRDFDAVGEWVERYAWDMFESE